ncbi:hypothetical protein ILYODFUR_037955 [Ilyodon furcidens]|uniref:Uncharacterized protein n=1 Tax=Ilyodon furcidens TaxID=33524 RepID=A0ABV0T501_9TELE
MLTFYFTLTKFPGPLEKKQAHIITDPPPCSTGNTYSSLDSAETHRSILVLSASACSGRPCRTVRCSPPQVCCFPPANLKYFQHHPRICTTGSLLCPFGVITQEVGRQLNRGGQRTG